MSEKTPKYCVEAWTFSGIRTVTEFSHAFAEPVKERVVEVAEFYDKALAQEWLWSHLAAGRQVRLFVR